MSGVRRDRDVVGADVSSRLTVLMVSVASLLSSPHHHHLPLALTLLLPPASRSILQHPAAFCSADVREDYARTQNAANNYQSLPSTHFFKKYGFFMAFQMKPGEN